MFLRNKTPFDATLARGRVTDSLAIATVVVPLSLRVEGGRADEPLPDALSAITQLPAWAEVSVTASGVARGPARAPFVRPVRFTVGSEVRRLIVFGPRRWERGLLGDLRATDAGPFEAVRLGFDRAFGGGYDLPPGLLPGTDLPHPGLRVAYQWNPHGVGYYADERAAAGSPLPDVEWPDQLVKAWDDRPDPAGFTPCHELLAYRMKDQSFELPALPFFRMHHHAPPRLIFADVPPGPASSSTGSARRRSRSRCRSHRRR